MSLELSIARVTALDSLPERECTKCGEWKSPAAFPADARKRSGLSSWCRDCYRENDARKHAKRKARNAGRDPYADPSPKRCPDCARDLPRREFSRDATKADGLKNVCRACHSRRVAEWRRTNPDKVNDTSARRRAAKAGVPSVPFDRTAYYGLPCYSCGAESTVHDHFFPLQGERTEFTWDAPWNVLPQCGACSSAKGNRNPLDWWARDHRPFDGLVIVADEDVWFGDDAPDPDWAHVAAGI